VLRQYLCEMTFCSSVYLKDFLSSEYCDICPRSMKVDGGTSEELVVILCMMFSIRRVLLWYNCSSMYIRQCITFVCHWV